MQVTIKAKALEVGDIIVSKSGSASFQYTVNSFGLWDRDQVHVSCDDYSIVFWFADNEEVVIERPDLLSFPVKVVFHNAADAAFPPVFMESLPSARVYANIVLRMEVSGCSAAVITTADHAEVMRPAHALDFVWAPLADVENLPTLGDHYPLMRLARHFQMAGAVDQARVERLAVFMRAGKSIAEQEAFKIAFLDPGPDPKPDPIIAAYVAEVSAPGIPYVSTSHVTLSRLYSKHGRARVDALLAEHWAAVRH